MRCNRSRAEGTARRWSEGQREDLQAAVEKAAPADPAVEPGVRQSDPGWERMSCCTGPAGRGGGRQGEGPSW